MVEIKMKKTEGNKMETKNIELFVQDIAVAENVDTGIITVSGYANRYKDEEGQLVIDRSEESVLPSGYDLSSFKKNPILLYQHDKSRPIGKIIAVELRPDGLYIEANVHKMLDPQAHYAVEQGILKTFSIGFMVKDYTEVDGVWFWTEVELLEVSIVSVPDNQDSIFNVLLDSPCNSGKCLLASKSIINDTKEVVKEWSSVDKKTLQETIVTHGEPGVAEEAYLIVKNSEDPSTWKFPHHDFDLGGLSILKGGLTSALSALKGAKDDEAHAIDDKLKAAKHLERHFTDLLEAGTVDNIPEDLTELIKHFEEKILAETKDNEEVPAEETPAEETPASGQPEDDGTINTPEQPEEGGNNPQNPDDGASNEPDGAKVTSIEDVTSFIEEASKSSEGLDTLLNLYANLEASINEALPKLLEEA